MTKGRFCAAAFAALTVFAVVACGGATSAEPSVWLDDSAPETSPLRCNSLELDGEIRTFSVGASLTTEHAALIEAGNESTAFFFSQRSWDGETGAPTASLEQILFAGFGAWPAALGGPQEVAPIGGRAAVPFRAPAGAIDVLIPREETLYAFDLDSEISYLSGDWRLGTLPAGSIASGTDVFRGSIDLSSLADVGRSGFVLSHAGGRVVSLVDATRGKLVIGNLTLDGALEPIGELGCEIPFDGPEWTPAQVDAVQVGTHGALIAYACTYSGEEMGLARIDGALHLHDLGKPTELSEYVQPRFVEKPGGAGAWLLTRTASAVQADIYVTDVSPNGRVQAAPTNLAHVVTFGANLHRMAAAPFAGGLGLVTLRGDHKALDVLVHREDLPALELEVPLQLGETEIGVNQIAVLASSDGTQLLIAWTDDERTADGVRAGSGVGVARVRCSLE